MAIVKNTFIKSTSNTTASEEVTDTSCSKHGNNKITHDMPDQRVRLSADIAKHLHKRLKMLSINTDRTILVILEDWISKYAPN